MWFVRCYWLPLDKATPLSENNHSTIRLVKNPQHHKCTQHNDIQAHSIRESFEHDKIDISYTSIDYQLVDIISKVLPHDNFEQFCAQNLMASLKDIKTTSHINTNMVLKSQLCTTPLLPFITMSSTHILIPLVKGYFHSNTIITNHITCPQPTKNYPNISQAMGVIFLFAHNLLLVSKMTMYEAMGVLQS